MLMIAHPLQHQIRSVLTEANRAAQELSAYIDDQVKGKDLVELWELEINFLTNHVRYHHPPTSVFISAVRAHNLGSLESLPNSIYDFRSYGPDYVVNGPFAKLVGIYPEHLLQESGNLLFIVGDYDLGRLGE